MRAHQSGVLALRRNDLGQAGLSTPVVHAVADAVRGGVAAGGADNDLDGHAAHALAIRMHPVCVRAAEGEAEHGDDAFFQPMLTALAPTNGERGSQDGQARTGGAVLTVPREHHSASSTGVHRPCLAVAGAVAPGRLAPGANVQFEPWACAAVVSPAAATGAVAPLALPAVALPAARWRASAALQASHWLCTNCGWASPRAFDAHDIASEVCSGCDTPASSLGGQASAEEMASMQQLSEANAFGRRLQLLRDRKQPVGAAVGVDFNDPGYNTAVAAHGRAMFAHPSDRLERRIADGAVLLDGFLAVRTSAALRVWHREESLNFLDHDSAEGLVADFAYAFGKQIEVELEPGVRKLVQVRQE